MAGVVPVSPKFQFSSTAGVPLAGGTVDAYLAGTTTRSNTWQDKAQASLNTNPIVLDASGSCAIFVANDKSYKFVVKNSAGVVQSHLGGDNIPGAASSASLAEAIATGLVDIETAKDAAIVEVDALVDDAEAALAATEVARDAALAATKIYASTAAGLAAVASGEYFYVPSTDPDESLILYKDNAGVAEEVKRYLSAEIFNDYIPPGYAWAVIDEDNNAAIGVKDDGTFAVDTMEAEEATITDLTVTTINGIAPSTNTDLIARRGGKYTHQINFINCTGQSLGEGSFGGFALTTAQEYDNIGFAARSAAPSAFVTLTVANTQVVSSGESPMYGTLGYVKELIAKENGISYTLNDYQLAACNNSYGGSSINNLKKGQTAFTNAMAQVLAAYNLATADSKSMSFQAVTWTQGETDVSMSYADYKSNLKTLASDFNTDGKAITGQHNDVRLICYQCSTASTAISLAQLDASNESPLITMACPMYQFTYGDSQHIDTTSAKWLGGYYALAYKRTVIDGEDWKPLQPVGHAVLGSTIDLIFNKDGLTLDTTLVPAQTNSGFTVKNGASVAQTISSVEILGPNRVRITVSGTPAAGWSVQYGFNTATGKSPYVSGAGNLRDSQGDTLTYTAISKTMHNWCVIFNYTI